MIGPEVRRDLFGYGPAVGQLVKVNDVWLEVVGVLAPIAAAAPAAPGRERPGRRGGGRRLGVAREIYLPRRPRPSASSSIRPWPRRSTRSSSASKARGRAAQETAARRSASCSTGCTAAPTTTSWWCPRRCWRESRRTQRLFNIVMGAIAGISLLVGGIGIMNIMLATVLERTREIGVRRAVGARSSDIRFQFIVESFAISLIGGLAGIVAGLALARGVAAVRRLGDDRHRRLDPALPTGVAMTVGLASGIYPALAGRGARSDRGPALRMSLLILGGTRFVGRHLAAAALAAGHRVTLFNRGRSNPGLFPEAEHLHGDRGEDLSLLAGRRWDAVLDVNGYLPRDVRASAEQLAGAVGLYVYVSTISVYRRLPDPRPHRGRAAPGARAGGRGRGGDPPDTGYGRLKALCERNVRDRFPDRSLIVRPCVVAGPWDPSSRFAWWVERIARGGEVLAPGRPDRPVELIDGRDLAAWTLAMTERGETGTFNAAGPESTLTMQGMLETCREATGGGATFTWVDDEFLEGRDVELPFWVPEAEHGYDLVDNSRARRRGLAFRPLAETARDVHAWVAADPDHAPQERLSREREAELLREWRMLESEP